MNLTEEKRQELISQLVLENNEILKSRTKADIYTRYGSLLRGASKDNKSVLIQRLLDYVADYKILALNQAKSFMQSLDIAEFDKYKTLEFALENRLSAKQTAEVYFKKLKERYVVGELSASTMGKTERQEVRRLANQLALNNPDKKDWTDEVHTLVGKHLSEFDSEYNKQYKKDLSDRGSSKRKTGLNVEKLMSWIEEKTNIYLAKKTLKRGWHEVSFLLALTSGRRMIEIHGEQCKYEYVGEYLIKAVGLAKKPVDDYTHVFYTLIPAKDWLLLLHKLPEERVNLGSVNGKDLVNLKIARDVQPIIKEVVKELDFKVPNDKGELKYGSHKSARKFYARYCMDFLNWDNADPLYAAKDYLAHERIEQTLSYRDVVFDPNNHQTKVVRQQELEAFGDPRF